MSGAFLCLEGPVSHPDPVPAYDPVEHIDVTPVGDEHLPVTDPGTDPTDTYVEGVDDEA